MIQSSHSRRTAQSAPRSAWKLLKATLSTRLGEERLAPLRGGGASEILGIKRTTLLARIKNLTTEVAEHAEINTGKGSRPRMQKEMMFMKENRASATAQRVAVLRAAHQLLDDPKVFDDPVALRILGRENALALQTDPHQFEATGLSPYVRAFAAARSRYAEEKLTLGVRRGVRQYVILGAGLDTFAYRNPYPEGVLHVFEVDYPAT